MTLNGLSGFRKPSGLLQATWTRKKFHSLCAEGGRWRRNWRHSAYNRMLVPGMIWLQFDFSQWGPFYDISLFRVNLEAVFTDNVAQKLHFSLKRGAFCRIDFQVSVVKALKNFTESWNVFLWGPRKDDAIGSRLSMVHMTSMWGQPKRFSSDSGKCLGFPWEPLAFEAIWKKRKEYWKRWSSNWLCPLGLD